MIISTKDKELRTKDKELSTKDKGLSTKDKGHACTLNLYFVLSKILHS